jgi:hypothetical protein
MEGEHPKTHHRRPPTIITPIHYSESSGKLTATSRAKVEIETMIKDRTEALMIEIADILEICAECNQTPRVFETQAILRTTIVKLAEIYNIPELCRFVDR